MAVAQSLTGVGVTKAEIATEHPDQESLQTHPATRKRIVYLYLHFLASEEA